MGKLTTCKDCGQQISKKADKCPNCGAPQKMSKGKTKALGCLGWIVIIAFIVMVWPEGENTSSTESKTNWRDQDNKSMAYFMCEDWVKDRLKSPSTAEFPSVFDGKLDNTFKDGTTYSVTSYVDAQNSFGGTIRTGFTCKTTQTSEDTWQLDQLELDD